jgi:hypothetical protein
MSGEPVVILGLVPRIYRREKQEVSDPWDKPEDDAEEACVRVSR